MSDLGIAIISWNRPHYLTEALASIAANDLTGVDVHLWQEGQYCRAHGEEKTPTTTINANREAFEAAALPSREWHQHAQHIGYAYQRRAIMPWMAERYPFFIVADDDVLWSPHTVRLMRVALKQFRRRRDIASISAGFRLLCDADAIDANRDRLRLADGRGWNLWLEGWWSDRLPLFWDHFDAYCERIAPWAYREVSRNDVRDDIARWVRGLGGVGSDIDEVSGETAMVRAIVMAGLKRLIMVVNRGSNIGDYGLNCTPELLEETGMRRKPIFASDADLAIKKFVVEEA